MAKKSTPPQRKNSIPDQNYTVKHDAQLLEYMIEIWPHQSRSAIKSYLTHRQIAINGKTETAFDLPLRAGDRLTWRSVGEERQNPNHKVKIVYEDDHIIVVDKKPGVLTMSTGREGEQTAYSVMMEHVRRRNKNNRIFIVHRLDRDTSGLLLFAKSEEIQEILQERWNENVIRRQYVGVVEGEMEQAEGQIVSWLTENPKSLKMQASPVDNGGKFAVTHYKTLTSSNGYSLVECELETGRKNQIRVHMSDLGHPVVGDHKYGASGDPMRRLGLHAYMLCFVHPVTGKHMKFETPVPVCFEKCLND